jgi:tetratricopeptide (TPR) repeat protein
VSPTSTKSDACANGAHDDQIDAVSGAVAGLGPVVNIKLHPGDPQGWVLRSYALHALKRTQAVIDLLTSAQVQFPDYWVVPYNLACYLSQLGRVEEARPLLKRALEIEPSAGLKQQALADPDLRPLWISEQSQ